jgi:hypothetical protein
MLEALALIPSLFMTEVSQKPAYEFRDDHFVLLTDKGGDVNGYAVHFRAIERSGLPVKVIGNCSSACTMVLHNPKACAMEWTVFGFHECKHPVRTALRS